MSTITNAATRTADDPRWQAVVARDRAADGDFFYSVRTTGVYCFPSCAARLARPENVRFHRTREEAEGAGFRPCKRCKPNQDGGSRRRAGAIRFAIGASSLGLVLAARSDAGLCAVLLGDDEDTLRRELQSRVPGAVLTEGGADLEALLTRVIAFVEVPARGLHEPLDLHGTPFQQSVWHALRGIPAGSTASYTDVAGRINMPNAARAVAQACGANPLAVVVPCHRVVRSNGELSSYRWGVERKQALLDREAAA